MYAPPKPDIPIITPSKLAEYDAFLLGIPTRYGNMPAQWKTFWDSTGGIWQSGGYWGKYAGVFVSSGTPGGGQESTVISSMSTLSHHGIIYVPLGYKTTFPILADLSEARGGSPWGAGTFAVSLCPCYSLWPSLTRLGCGWISQAYRTGAEAGQGSGRGFLLDRIEGQVLTS
jgi:NAD(P)H:quinone oxidoreductase type IV